MGMEKLSEVSEVSRPEINEFQDIKPQNGMTFDKAKDVVKSMFEGMKSVVDSAEMKMKLREMKEDYIEELKLYSEYKDTLPDQFFDISCHVINNNYSYYIDYIVKSVSIH